MHMYLPPCPHLSESDVYENLKVGGGFFLASGFFFSLLLKFNYIHSPPTLKKKKSGD